MGDLFGQDNLFLQRIAGGHRASIVLEDTDTHDFSAKPVHRIYTIKASRIAALTDARMDGSTNFVATDTIGANISIYGHITALRLGDTTSKVICYYW